MSLRIILTVYFLSVSLIANSAEVYSDSFLGKISKASIKLHCEDEVFLKQSRFDKKECVSTLSKYSKSCNQLLKPFVPNINIEKIRDEVDLEAFRKLGEIYSLCLIGNTFQSLEKRVHNK